MQPYTPQQVTAIKAWTEERDGLIRDIGKYSTELDVLKNSTKDEGLALEDLRIQIATARGRLVEIDALEARMRDSLPKDIAELEVRKSRLEGECLVLEEKKKAADSGYDTVAAATVVLQSAHDTMKDQAVIVTQVLGAFTEADQKHAGEMKDLFADIRIVALDLIDRGNKTVVETQALLEEIPKVTFALQKSLRVRRKYPEGHPNFVPGE